MELGALGRYTLVKNQSPKKARGQPFARYGWLTESISMAASFGCMSAIVTILAKTQGRPLSDWNFFISLNATIAIFITAAKSTALLAVSACLAQYKWVHFRTSSRKLHELDLFEEASRGPLGCANLFLRIRANLGMASIGAFVTILALGLDTFAQQVLTFDSREIEVHDGNVLFGVCHMYDGHATHQPETGLAPFTPEASTVDLTMQGAVYGGIFNIAPTPPYQCTSNCTWKDSYASLGFASHCKDVTAPTMATLDREIIGTGGESMNMTTPGGVHLAGRVAFTSYQTMAGVAAVGTMGESDPNKHHGIPLTEPDSFLSSEMMRFGVMVSKASYGDTSVTDEEEYIAGLEITECSLNLTAYIYSNISASGNNLTIGDHRMVPLDPGQFKQRILNGSDADQTLVFNQTGLPALVVRTLDIGALMQFFTSDSFSGYIYDGEEPAAPPKGIGNVFREHPVQQVFDNMALSMTDHLRSSASATNAQGLAIKSVVFVRVRWIWLILPFAVEIASGLLLVLSIIMNRNELSHLWKSSTVAILYHDVVQEDDSEAVLQPQIGSSKELDRLAKKIKAKLK